MRVACAGGVNLDIKARSAAPLVMASSNPGRIHRSAGGVAVYGRSIGAAHPVEYGLAAASLTVESEESVAPHLDRAAIERRRARAAPSHGPKSR